MWLVSGTIGRGRNHNTNDGGVSKQADVDRFYQVHKVEKLVNFKLELFTENKGVHIVISLMLGEVERWQIYGC